jgi:hypothetical protein
VSRFSVRPTASAVIAVTALVVALGGSAYAAAKINGKDIAKHSIAGNRLKGNALTGAQIKESKLGKVPAAKTAGTAAKAATATNAKQVNGNDVMTFAFTVANNEAFHTVLVPGGAITADCGSGAVNLDLTGASDTGESYVVEGSDVTNGPFDNGDASLTTSDFDSLSPDSPPAPTSGAGVAVITRGSSGVTTINFSYRANPGNSCTYNGSVVGSS